MPAKFNLLVAITVPLVPVIPLLACGGSSSTVDAHIVTHDSGSGSGSGSGSNVTCAVPASLGTPTFSQSSAKFTAGSGSDLTNTLSWQGQVGGITATTAVDVLIFGGCGSGSGSQCGGFPTPDWPTTFGPKSGLDLATSQDSLVAVLANLSGNQFQDIYLSTAGTLNITAAQNGAGHTYSGTASNVTAVHFDLAGSGGPAADGCQTNITSMSFTGSAMFDGKTVIIYGPTRDEAIKQYLAHRYQ